MRILAAKPGISALAWRRVLQPILAGFALVVATACVPSGNEDILIPLKELNQEIAPLAVSCPQWHYPVGTTVNCRLESAVGEGTVQLKVEKGKITPLDLPGAIERMEPLP